MWFRGQNVPVGFVVWRVDFLFLAILMFAVLAPDWFMHGDLVRSCMCMCVCGVIGVVILCLTRCSFVFGGGR